jgi:hypothetical protein
MFTHGLLRPEFPDIAVNSTIGTPPQMPVTVNCCQRHFVIIDRPDVVIDAINQVVQSIRDNAKL